MNIDDELRRLIDDDTVRRPHEPRARSPRVGVVYGLAALLCLLLIVAAALAVTG